MTLTARHYLFPVSFMAACLAGCGAEAGRSGEFTTRDSASVEIVDNVTAPSSDLRSALDLPAGRMLPTSELSAVSAARLLSDGSVVATNDAASELILFDSAGRAAGSVGRRGDGPGEFRGFRALWRCAGDTLVVRSGLAGVQFFDADGTYVRMNASPVIRGYGVGMADDCSAILLLLPTVRGGQEFTDSLTVGWYDLDRDTVDATMMFADQQRQTIEYLGERLPIPVPFAPRAMIATRNGRTYAGTGESAQVQMYDRAGRLSRIIRWQAENAPLTRQDKDGYAAVRTSLDSTIQEGATQRVPELHHFELPTVKPIYSQLLVDDEERLWVRRYPSNWDGFERTYGPALNAEDANWWVFDASGRLLGAFSTPSNFQIRDIRAGHVVGVRSGPFNVPELYVYPLVSW